MLADAEIHVSDRDAAAVNWVLNCTSDPEPNSRRVPLNPMPFTVGRKPEAGLTIPRKTVSGLHAEFRISQQSLILHDLGSTNGTFVNGYRLHGEQAVADGDIIQFADATYQLIQDVNLVETGTMRQDFCDRALVTSQFTRLLREQAMTPFYQPLIDFRSGEILAYEVLARSRFSGLRSAGALFSVAEELGRAGELSTIMRNKGVEESVRFDETPHLFLNSHPSEVNQSEDWLDELRASSPLQKMTIEIHEGAVTDVSTMLRIRARTRDLGLGLAFDDFGVGQARIAEVWEIRPDYVKFDRRIIEKIDEADSKRRRFVASLADAVQQVGVEAIAEGIETVGELQACRDMGFVIGQGYYLGHPQSVDTWMTPPA